MQFCTECHNMYYLKIQDEEGIIGNTLVYYCRNCGHEDTTLNTTNICVSDIQLLSSEKKYTHTVNEYTKYDPTLPRINTIKCPNQECSSNMKGGAPKTAAEKEAAAALKAAEKETAAALKATLKEEAAALKAAEKEAAATLKAATKAAEKEAAATLKATLKAASKAVPSKAATKAASKAASEAASEAATKAASKAEPEGLAASEAAEKLETILEEPETNQREVIYIRYDDTNMKYVYLCVHCDTTWRTDNRL